MRRAFGVVLLLAGGAIVGLGVVVLLLAFKSQELKFILGSLLLIGVGSLVAVIGSSLTQLQAFVNVPAVVILVAASAFVLNPRVAARIGMSGNKQKQTVIDLKTLGAAVEARAKTGAGYPNVPSINALANLLEPTYIRSAPRIDAWGYEYRYEFRRGTNPSENGYAIASSGEDGRWARPRLRFYTPAATTNFNDDIVFSNGSFVQYPEGTQSP